jgi:hypothetical protein
MSSFLNLLSPLPLENLVNLCEYLCGNDLEVGKKYFMRDDLGKEFYLGVLLRKEKFIHPYLGLESNYYNIFNFENTPDSSRVKLGVGNLGVYKVFYQLPSFT